MCLGGELAVCVGIEDVANFRGEAAESEWLLQECNVSLEYAGAEDGVVGIPGDKQNFQMRHLLFQLDGKLAAVHFGHDNVANQEIDSAAMGFGDADGFGAILCFEHRVPRAFQEVADERADALFVFDEKNRFRARSRRRR